MPFLSYIAHPTLLERVACRQCQGNTHTIGLLIVTDGLEMTQSYVCHGCMALLTRGITR